MTDAELNKLSKEELEELGRTKGLELDRRLTKSKLVKTISKLFASSSSSTPKSYRQQWLEQATEEEVETWKNNPGNHNPQGN